MVDDLEWKLNALRSLYRSKQRNGLMLEKQNNISWLLRGRTYVNIASTQSIVDVLINDQGIYLITNNIEAQRMITEELCSPSIKVIDYPWHDVIQREKICNELTNGNYLTDAVVEDELRNFRIILTKAEQCSYLQLGKDVAEAMEVSCFHIKRGMSERSVAAFMAMQCMERGIEPIILLVAADERIRQYRHPLPTLHTIEHMAMLVIGGRRDGLCVGITRFVSFSPLSQQLKEIRDAVLRIDAMLWSETRPGSNVQHIFQLLLEQYRLEGYPQEWQLHHQGGLIGYNPREVRVTPHTSIVVKSGQAYAWNPSITGYKAEDSFLIDESANIWVTRTQQLPHVSVTYKGQQIVRPDILVRAIPAH